QPVEADVATQAGLRADLRRQAGTLVPGTGSGGGGGRGHGCRLAPPTAHDSPVSDINGRAARSRRRVRSPARWGTSDPLGGAVRQGRRTRGSSTQVLDPAGARWSLA